MNTITHEGAVERIEGVLKAAGIKLTLSCCSCCAIFKAEFPDGAKNSDSDGFYISCDGIEHQRG